MTCINQNTFSTLSEALAFRGGALEAMSVPAWLPDFHVGSFWAGGWSAMSGHRVVWISDQDAAFSVETLIIAEKDVPEELRPEAFMDVFRSAKRFKAFAILLLLIAVDPIPRVHPNYIMDALGQKLSQMFTEACIARSEGDDLEMLRCIYGDEFADTLMYRPENMEYYSK